jgi:acetolactate synthase-1/2/3 large subunit
VIDQRALLRPLVKGCFEVETVGAGAVVARAVELATDHPMGPVLIELSPETALQTAASHDIRMPTKRAQRGPARADLVDEAVALVDRAERPLLVAGFDAARSGAAGAVRALAEARNIPVMTTYKAKGVLPERHALALGAAGLSPLADGILLPVCGAADVVILAGYDPVEMRAGWIDPFARDAQVIDISPGPYHHAMYAATLRLDGDIARTLSALADRAAPVSAVWPCGRVAKAKADLQAAFATPKPWGPHAVIDVLEAELPGDAVVTVDSGAHRILLSQKMRVDRPLALLQSAGFCTMGAAVPLAAGYKLANPKTPVVAVVGDGGLEMGLGELATLRDAGLAIVIVVLQDQSLALIELKQRQAALPRAGVRLGATKFKDIACAFGGNGYRAGSAAELRHALGKAFAAAEFSVVACDIEAGDYAGRI